MNGKAGVQKSASFKFSVGDLDVASVRTILSWFLLAWIGRRTIFVWGIFILFVLLLLLRNSPRPVQPGLQPKGDANELDPKRSIRRPNSGTHDIKNTKHHTPIASFGADLHSAIGAALPRRDEIRYSRVIALLLSWEDDNLGVYSEINELENVFANIYHFDVEKFEIPSLEPVMQVNECITGLIKRAGKDTLLIVYYGGHGRGVEYSTEAPIWFPNGQNSSVSLPSGGIQCLLEEASSDVLLLYDCCHSATVPTCGSGKGGVTEVIAACGYETTASEVGEHSFTKALLDILILDSDFPFSVGRLHSRILSNLKCWSPAVKELNREKLKQWQPRRTPVYTLLSETKPRRSIVLGPLPLQKPSSNSAQEHGTPTSTGSTSSTPSTSENNSPSENGEVDSEGNKCAQILLAIRVDETSFDKDEWVEWMKTVPINGREIHVEGRWGSFSTLLLLRMSVEIWNLLPENPAYSFVGFVTTPNTNISLHPSLPSTPNSDNAFDTFVNQHAMPKPAQAVARLDAPQPPGDMTARSGYRTLEIKVITITEVAEMAVAALRRSICSLILALQSEVLVHSSSSTSSTPEDGESSSPLSRLSFDRMWMQQMPMMEIYHRARLVAGVREIIYNNVEQLSQRWNRTEAITLWEKVLFICGVFNILISGYIIGGYPQIFHYWYTGQLLYLLPIRYYTFYKRDSHLFLADLCYAVNILCMCTIWLCPRSTRLFIGTYCLAFGNNAISITMWRSLMVFHSLDKVTTVFIYVMPCVALHCLVHLMPPDLQQERFPAIWAIKMLAPSLRVQDSLLAMTVWSTVPYLIWQLAYYFMVTVRQREKIAAGSPTSFTWLRKRYAQTTIGRVMLSLPESLQEPAFMMLQYIYILLTCLPCLIWFRNRYASATFLIVVFFGSVYNGATFYSELFRKRNKNEEESVG